MSTVELIPYENIIGKDYQEETTLLISKEKFDNVEFIAGQTTFTFTNCRFKKVSIENNDKIDFFYISIQFIDCFISDLYVNNLTSENISLLLNSTILSGKIQSKLLKTVSFNNCIVNNNVFLIGQNNIDISYTEENIFPIRWKKLINNVNTNLKDLLSTKQSYRIYESKRINFFTKEKKNNNRGVYRNKFQSLEDLKIGYLLNNDQKKLLNLNLSITYSQQVENTETNISSSALNSLYLSGYSNGKISIENTKIDNWYIRDFSTLKDANFYNLTSINSFANTSKIEIHKCNLDNTWFNSVDFSSYSIVSFYRTKFNKAVFTSCNFPSDYTSFEKFKTLENVHYPEKKSDNYYKDQYEIFLQLKIILESTGNFYESQKLQAISNDALLKINHISKWDKCILKINKISNNHGLSIERPLLLFFLFSITFYILYLMSLQRIFNNNTVDYSLFGYYFSFIDITHRPDFLVEKEKFNVFSLFIDFVSKIVSGFFIYQFISAFRKYAKK